MEINDLNRRLEYLKADLEIIKKERYHERSWDLLNIVLLEDVPELINFIQKVNNAFLDEFPNGNGPCYEGAKENYEVMKRTIYETK